MTRTQTTTLSAAERRPLGSGIVAFRDVALCDRFDHEVAIVTDGQRAYTYGISPTRGRNAGRVLRSSVILVATCQQDDAHGDPCDGQVTWALDTDGCWGADGDALALLARFGQPVEQ
jgi:hypothetical protein